MASHHEIPGPSRYNVKMHLDNFTNINQHGVTHIFQIDRVLFLVVGSQILCSGMSLEAPMSYAELCLVFGASGDPGDPVGSTDAALRCWSRFCQLAGQ